MARLPQIRSNTIETPSIVPASGGADAATSLFSTLAQSSQRMRQDLQPYLDQQTRDQAAADVLAARDARDENGLALDVPTRRVLTRQDAIYNEVVSAGVISTARADFADEIERLAQEHRFDPEGYQAAASEYIEGYTSGLSNRDLSMEMVLQLETSATQAFATEGARLEANAREAQVKETQDSLERRLSQISAAMATSIERDGLEGVSSNEFEELEREASDIVDILVENPLYGWSAERGAEAIDALMNQGTELLQIQGMETVYYDDGALAALKFIDESVNRMTLDQAERIGARSRLQQRLSVLQQMTALEEDEKEAEVDAIKERAEASALAFEAELLTRMGEGEKPTQLDMLRLNAFVTAGIIKPARMSVYVNARTSDDETPSDALNRINLMEYARSGVDRQAVIDQAYDLIGQGSVGIEAYNEALAAWEESQDTTLQEGEDIIEGLFAASWMDRAFGGVQAKKAEAKSDLREWYSNNPDISVQDMRERARLIGQEYQRAAPEPPLPVMPGYAHPTFLNVDNVDEWFEAAEEHAFDLYIDDDEEFNRAIDMLESRRDYVKTQALLLSQGTPSNGEE